MQRLPPLRYFGPRMDATYCIIIVVLKRQNSLKVGTDKSKLKVKRCSQYQMMSGKDFLKSHVL